MVTKNNKRCRCWMDGASRASYRCPSDLPTVPQELALHCVSNFLHQRQHHAFHIFCVKKRTDL